MTVLSLVSWAAGTIIHVPGDQSTIQGGIDAAVGGDTVLVHPGTYVENINFNGKNIVVGSLLITTGDTSYISQTILNGNDSLSVVSFHNGEDTTAMLYGLSIVHGKGTVIEGYSRGGGILCIESTPSLCYLNVRENWARFGGGIYCDLSEARI
ncbi:MAG: hypothetical protein JSU61_07800, partial [Fidelibacterota bacterium]